MVNDDRTTALRGVILDVDGTLIDSNDAHAKSWVETLEEFGYDVAYDAVRSRIGEGGDKLLPQVSGVDSESEEGKQISKRRSELFKEKYLPTIQPFPKVRELLERMRDEGLTLAVGSSAQRHELEPFLEIANVADLIAETTSSSDAESSKPDPDIVHAALGELGYGPDEVLMLGDTPYDVEAAARAKVRTIAVRCGGWDDDGLEGAIAIYEDPADLLARFDDSPVAASKRKPR